MHCLGSVGPILNACFHCGSPSKLTTTSVPSYTPTDTDLSGTNHLHRQPPQQHHTHPIFASSQLLHSSLHTGRSGRSGSYASARNRAVRFVPPAAWDRPALSCRSGHWTMRYTRPTRNNLHPWSSGTPHGDGRTPFDLVPWRQRRGGRHVDLAHTAGWEPSQQQRAAAGPARKRSATPSKASTITTTTTTTTATLTTTNRHQRRHRRRRRRLVRIRVVLSFEFRKRFGALGTGATAAAVEQQRRTLQRQQRRFRSRANLQQSQPQPRQPTDQVFVFDPKLFRLSADWLGYFSQRPAGVEELLQNMDEQVEAVRRAARHNSCANSGCPAGPKATALPALGAGDRMDYRSLFGKVSRLFFGENGARQVFKQVPCLPCRQRYTFREREL